eukprot:TRINITY_DN9131_c0_g1_i1.p1 TRINITY_DN9131_c0_g1~~TRINITY_DN9131_c0_g1_i1.p1  ORF type:complete len:437 (-),score=88.03 TRINITY_DN9131_c0_g1_i1:39-1199(-)
MAQNFVGSNNINLLHPQGQFGTRLEGGKDAASARYIHTFLPKMTRYLFLASDDPLLTYLDEDGQMVEPLWFVPIIPLVLCNGNRGIGTGWSSNIPQYNPLDLVNNIKRLLKGEKPVPMTPWYKGFGGSFTWDASTKTYRIQGKWKKLDKDTLEITELPIGRWTSSYAVFLESLMLPSANGKPGLITSFKDYSTHSKVHFVVTCPNLQNMTSNNIFFSFKLSTRISTNNMHLFDPNGEIKKYPSTKEILEDFYHVRLGYYEKRKKHVLADISEKLQKHTNQIRFINDVVTDKIDFRKMTKTHVIKYLTENNYHAVTSDDAEEGSFDYLLNMKLWNLTQDHVEKLQLEEKKLREHKNKYELLSPKDLWNADLDTFLLQWQEDTKEESM